MKITNADMTAQDIQSLFKSIVPFVKMYSQAARPISSVIANNRRVYVTTEEKIKDALGKMHGKKIATIAIVDMAGRFVGYLDQAFCMAEKIKAHKNGVESVVIRELLPNLAKNILTLSPADNLATTVETFAKCKNTTLAIVDPKTSKLVGVISRADLVKLFFIEDKLCDLDDVFFFNKPFSRKCS